MVIGVHPDFVLQPVQQVHFCAHANPENAGYDGQPATNHWSLFLEIDPTRSVRVDVAPGNPHSPGMVILEMKNYNVSSHSICDVCSQVSAGTTVETILQLIIDKGRDRYVFAPVGEGCRYWLWTFAWEWLKLSWHNVHLMPFNIIGGTLSVMGMKQGLWRKGRSFKLRRRVVGGYN